MRDFTVEIYDESGEALTRFRVKAVDAAHAVRQALDGQTGLLGNPDHSRYGAEARPITDG